MPPFLWGCSGSPTREAGFCLAQAWACRQGDREKGRVATVLDDGVIGALGLAPRPFGWGIRVCRGWTMSESTGTVGSCRQRCGHSASD
jgi:hypothetical protein